MTIYLDATDLFTLASRSVTGDLQVRDPGLFDVAARRPEATLFDAEVYPTLWLKAAALLDGIVCGRPLRQGNWKFGWLATVVFCDINGWRIDADDSDALDVIRGISRGEVEVAEVANWLQTWGKRSD